MELPNIPSKLVAEIINNLVVLQNPNINNFAKLEAVYKESDKINDFLKPYFSCNRGCCFCCKYDVLITKFEAMYISLKTGINLRNNSFSFYNNTYCPFLKNNVCSIYNFRPLICRSYHVYGNPNDCEIDYKNHQSKIQIQYGTAGSGYGNAIYKEFGRFIESKNNSMFHGEKLDIRNYFSNS